MKIATILFTYNRSWHTKQVLDALKENTTMSEKLYIFQDGLACAAHRPEWEKVNLLIHQVDWCDCVINVSKKNKGLAESIVSGINVVFEDSDAVIVLEDDCVPALGFVSFMKQCFEKYENDKRIYNVSGYTWPMDIEEDSYDIYACGRSSSWGWGTWKDRWNHYKRDYDSLIRIRNDKNLSRNLAIWGNDLADMLVETLKGLNDSWAVFWSLMIIENKGICINPYRPLIKNIGLDGSGVHCTDQMDRFSVILDNECRKDFKLPDEIQILESTEKAFLKVFGSHTAFNQKSKEKTDIIIYGKGRFFSQCEAAINNRAYIQAIVDKYKRGWYAGKKIIKQSEIVNYDYEYVVVMIDSVDECERVVNELVNIYNIPQNKILLGRDYIQTL